MPLTPAYLHAFTTAMARCGGTAFPFPWSDAFDSTMAQKGLCNALSLKWVKDRHCSIDFRTDTSSAGGREEVMTLHIGYYMHGRFGVGAGPDAYLPTFGLQASPVMVIAPVTPADIKAAIAERASGYFHVGIKKPPHGGHALAVDLNRPAFYDGSFGWATFPSRGALFAGLIHWLNVFYSQYTRQALLTYFR